MDILEYIDRVKANFDKQPEPRYNTKKYFMGGSVTTPKRGLVDGPGSYAGEEKLVLGPNKGMYPLQLRNTETGKWKTEYFKTKAERIARQKKYDAKLQPRNFYKIPKERRNLLQKYAKSIYKKPYIELNEQEKGIVKGRAKRGFFTTKEDIRKVSTKAEKEKFIKAFPEIDFDFTKYPRYGVPLKLPNGKINPEYTSAFNFRRRGYKKNLSKKSLPVTKQREIVARFELPPGVKEWNFDVDRGGYLYGIPDTAGKNRNLGERLKNFVNNPKFYKVSADFGDPAGWMLLQMNRAYENALAKGLEPEFEPIYDKINNKKRIVGFTDNKYGGGKDYFVGKKYIEKFNGTSMRVHPDYNNVKKYFNITERARLKPNKVITDLLVKGGIGEDRLTLNTVLNYLINEKGVQPTKKAVVLHHKGGIGNPTRDLQIVNALANSQVKGIENAMRRDPKNITAENIQKLKNFGVSVTIDGKTYGGGPKSAIGGLKQTEQFVEEKVRGFTQKDFTKLKKYLAAMSRNPKCKSRFFLGGRVGFEDGSVSLDSCARDGAKVANSGKIRPGAEFRNFAKLGQFFVKAGTTAAGVADILLSVGAGAKGLGVGLLLETGFAMEQASKGQPGLGFSQTILGDLYNALVPDEKEINLENRLLKSAKTEEERVALQNLIDFNKDQKEFAKKAKRFNYLYNAPEFEKEGVDLDMLENELFEMYVDLQNRTPKVINKEVSKVLADVSYRVGDEGRKKLEGFYGKIFGNAQLNYKSMDRDVLAKSYYDAMVPQVSDVIGIPMFANTGEIQSTQQQLGLPTSYKATPQELDDIYDMGRLGASSGGIASGPPPEKGPQSQGLAYLMKNGKR